MPIKIPDALPAAQTLHNENIFTITEQRATTQDIRPLRILVLNLMPTKIVTETQLARVLGNTPLQVEMELLQTSTYVSKNTAPEHMLAFYKTFDQVRDERFDGMVITGAPVENMPFEEVSYWEELCEIMEWSKTHVTSTLHICWGAQAGLYYHYGIDKVPLPEKMFGRDLDLLERSSQNNTDRKARGLLLRELMASRGSRRRGEYVLALAHPLGRSRAYARLGDIGKWQTYAHLR